MERAQLHPTVDGMDLVLVRMWLPDYTEIKDTMVLKKERYFGDLKRATW